MDLISFKLLLWISRNFLMVIDPVSCFQFVMAISNPLNGERKAGTVGKPFPGVEVSENFLFNYNI